MTLPAKIAEYTEFSPRSISMMRRHTFLDFHDIPYGPGTQYLKRQRFDADKEIAELWTKAYRRSFVGQDAERFEAILAHEYGEQYLMRRMKMPYRSLAPSSWEQNVDGTFISRAIWGSYGAHEAAPLAFPATDPYRHYKIYGIPEALKPPWPN